MPLHLPKPAQLSRPLPGLTTSTLTLRFPPHGKQRIRKVVTRSRGRPTYAYPSWKMGRMIECESRAEKDVMCLLDADPRVRYFYEQPLEILYEKAGDLRRHIPDVLVVFEAAKELWEIKPHKDALDNEQRERVALLTPPLAMHGYGYRLILADEYARPLCLKSAKRVLRLGRGNVPFLEREQLRQHLVTRGGCYWGELQRGDFGPLGAQHGSRLMLEGSLQWNVEIPLDDPTWLAFVGDAHARYTGG